MNDKKIIVMEEFEWQKLAEEQTKGIIEVKTPVGNIIEKQIKKLLA